MQPEEPARLDPHFYYVPLCVCHLDKHVPCQPSAGWGQGTYGVQVSRPTLSLMPSALLSSVKLREAGFLHQQGDVRAGSVGGPGCQPQPAETFPLRQLSAAHFCFVTKEPDVDVSVPFLTAGGTMVKEFSSACWGVPLGLLEGQMWWVRVLVEVHTLAEVDEMRWRTGVRTSPSLPGVGDAGRRSWLAELREVQCSQGVTCTKQAHGAGTHHLYPLAGRQQVPGCRLRCDCEQQHRSVSQVHQRRGDQTLSRGDHTWTTMLGQSVRLQAVPIQSLSELERACLQEVALVHLEVHNLSILRETRKRRKSLRRKFDSFSKEKKERDKAPKAFGIPLSQAIANDRAHKQRQDAVRESRRDCLDLEASVLHFRAEKQQQQQQQYEGSSSGTASSQELPSKALPRTFLDSTPRSHRRGGLSVDSISDLVESQSRLLEALQLSHPNELDLKRPSSRVQTKLSLNPICRQVPRVVQRCCCHILTYGLQTVGIFRVGSSKKRVRQLRDEFDQGADVVLDEEHSVHNVAALLKEFLRDMPDPLLPRELYCAFLHATELKETEQLLYLQLLLYLLPPCNCDTLLQLLELLHTVQSHAEDTVGPDGQEVPGNKMTAANLAVIFGPNLLQHERGSEKDATPQALEIEDSAAIIAVTLQLIQNYKLLFMVSAEIQQEVLMSLIQTDPDIIDYLLRRKLSGRNTSVEAESNSSEQDRAASLGSGGPTCEDLSQEATCSLDLSDLPGVGSLSSEVFLSVLCLSQSRKRSSGDAASTNMGQMRQFHSHHNLLNLTQGPLMTEGHPHEDSPAHAVPQQDSPEDCVWVRQEAPTSTTQGAVSQPLNFWDFFTGKVSGSETVV
ncbi:rho GTPase-activating protein 6-like isoform X1 [Arapaima gigas]